MDRDPGGRTRNPARHSMRVGIAYAALILLTAMPIVRAQGPQFDVAHCRVPPAVPARSASRWARPISPISGRPRSPRSAANPGLGEAAPRRVPSRRRCAPYSGRPPGSNSPSSPSRSRMSRLTAIWISPRRWKALPTG